MELPDLDNLDLDTELSPVLPGHPRGAAALEVLHQGLSVIDAVQGFCRVSGSFVVHIAVGCLCGLGEMRIRVVIKIRNRIRIKIRIRVLIKIRMRRSDNC